MTKKLKKLEIAKGKINIMSLKKKKRKPKLNFNSIKKNWESSDLSLPDFVEKKKKKRRRQTLTTKN